MLKKITSRRHFSQLLAGLVMLNPALHAVAQGQARTPVAQKTPAELAAFGQGSV